MKYILDYPITHTPGSQNRLKPPLGEAKTAFRNICELQLNVSVEMGYNRLQVLTTDGHDPDSLPNNSTLQEINLDSNQLSNWKAVAHALRLYTALQRLVIPSNCIDFIDAAVDTPLMHLKHLSLSFNRLNTWRDIDVLSLWCPALESLTLAGNPLVEDAVLGKNARQFIIARIPSLTILDAAAVSSKERVDSELFYLSYVSKHGPPDEQAKCQEYPRWKALCEKHGRPDNLPSAAQNRQDTMSNRLIEVNIHRCKNEPPDRAKPIATDPAVPLRVLPTMSLRTFRMKVAKTLKIARTHQSSIKLWLKMPDDSLAEIDQDDNHDLDWWGVEDHADIYLHSDQT